MQEPTRTAPLGVLALLVASVLAATAAGAQDRRTLDTLQDIGPAILRCWRIPNEVGDYDVRVRLSFKRDGAVLGQPRIVFSRFTAGAAEQRVILRSVVETLAACTPLSFSDSLGGAVAGRPFTLRFAPPSRRVHGPNRPSSIAAQGLDDAATGGFSEATRSHAT